MNAASVVFEITINLVAGDDTVDGHEVEHEVVTKADEAVGRDDVKFWLCDIEKRGDKSD